MIKGVEEKAIKKVEQKAIKGVQEKAIKRIEEKSLTTIMIQISSRPPRKRPHSGDREEGGGGGGDDESGVRHIAAQVPVNILEIPVFGLKLPEVAKVHQCS